MEAADERDRSEAGQYAKSASAGGSVSDTLDRAEGRFMQMIATGSSLQAVLEAIVAQVELLVPGTFASVLLVDKSGHCLRHGAAPSLPVAYQRAVDGVAIGPSSGSCGTAAFRAAEVITEDIAADPLWDNFRSLALKYDLRSAWSTPICGGAGEVLGTLAFYRSTCWRPGRYEHHVVAMATHAAAIAIRRDREEQRLRKLSAAVEQSADSVLIMDLEGYVEYVNESFLRVSGFERDEVLGSRPAILQESRASSPVGREIWDALRRGEPWRGELVNRRKDGRAYFEDCRISPLREPGGLITHYLTVGSDVTEYKRISAELALHRHHLEDLVEKRTSELELAKVQAEAANRAKGTFLANMSHEIRTPMNSVLGLTHILREHTVDAEQQALLTRLQDSAQHLMHVINGILDLSKIDAGKISLEDSELSIDSIVSGVAELIRHDAQAKGLQVRVEVAATEPALRGDPTRLTQALLNYACNAIKFTETGHVILRTRVLRADEQSQLLRFEVEDSGEGVAPERLAQLFSAFEQGDPSTTRKYGGSGLGLAITRGLAQVMGGAAGAESTPGRGSTFWFTAVLQCTPRSTVTTDAVRSEMRRSGSGADTACRSPRRFSGRILLAEDNPTNQFVLKKLLTDLGVEVDVAENGRVAVDRLLARDYDLVLMDVQMPEMDGLAATRAIRKLPTHAWTPIVALTANAFTDDRERCLNAGMNGFLPKPIDPKLLREALERWLR